MLKELYAHMERVAASVDSEEDGRMAYSIRESIQSLQALEEAYSRPSITLEEFLEAVKDSPPSDPVDDVNDIDPFDLELEAHWKAGFLRGAKFWYGRTEAGTMWQSEQNECWQAAGRLWPAVRPESLEDARQIALAQAQAGAGEGQGEGACICEGSGRVLIDDDAEVPCPHCSEGEGA